MTISTFVAKKDESRKFFLPKNWMALETKANIHFLLSSRTSFKEKYSNAWLNKIYLNVRNTHTRHTPANKNVRLSVLHTCTKPIETMNSATCTDRRWKFNLRKTSGTKGRVARTAAWARRGRLYTFSNLPRQSRRFSCLIFYASIYALPSKFTVHLRYTIDYALFSITYFLFFATNIYTQYDFFFFDICHPCSSFFSSPSLSLFCAITCSPPRDIRDRALITRWRITRARLSFSQIFLVVPGRYTRPLSRPATHGLQINAIKVSHACMFARSRIPPGSAL